MLSTIACREAPIPSVRECISHRLFRRLYYFNYCHFKSYFLCVLVYYQINEFEANIFFLCTAI